MPLRHLPDRAARLLLTLLVVLVLTGCASETRVVYDGWGGLRAMADAKAAPGSRPGESEVYTILLERYVGRDRLDKAQALSQQLGSKGVPDIDVQDSSGVTTVSVGRFTDPGSPKAQALLRKVRSLEIDGNRYYDSVNFVTARGGRKIYDPLDVSQYHGQYTLQIGYYDKHFQGNYKAAAEEAARTLREEGVEAYYYHGPHASLLCVGLFGEGDFEQIPAPNGGAFTIQRYGPRIRELQEKYPYNLGNGVTLIEKNAETGQVLGEQESCLVRVM